MTTKKPTDLYTCVQRYEAIKRNVTKAEKLVLELSRHPDATVEQIINMTTSYKRWHKDFVDVTSQLRVKFPPEQSLFKLPWNN